MPTKTELGTPSAASSGSQAAIPSPPSAIAPLSHEPLTAHHHARSASVPTGQHQIQHQHFQHIEPHIQTQTPVTHLPQRQEVSAHHAVHPNKTASMDQSMHMSGNYPPSMDHYEHQSYGGHYNASSVIHPTINSQPQQGVDYNDSNYYSSFYASYDDQMRPYSASSNSCSSSNSDGDSQLAPHHHSLHHNNNHDHHPQHPHRQGIHPQNSQLVHTQNNGSHLDSANLSPEYVDCMDQRATQHHSFEVNCFGGIGDVGGIHHIPDELQSNYMHGSNHGSGINSSGSIVLNGNASSGGSVLFNGNNLTGPQTIADSIQYTSVIVDSNNYHMSNDQYVH